MIDYILKWNFLHSLPKSLILVLLVFLILLATLIITFLVDLIFKYFINKFRKTAKIWDDILVSSFSSPAQFLIWLFGVIYSVHVVKPAIGDLELVELIGSVCKIGLVIAIVWFLIKFTQEFKTRFVSTAYNKNSQYDKTTIDAIGKLIFIIIIFTGVLVILQEVNIPVSGLLAFGGGATLIAGFGAKDILANFFGGLMVYLDRPFSVDDWIASPDKEIEGIVEEIGWRSTRIRAFDKVPIYVPNALFSTLAIKNPSRMTNRRIKTKFGLRYCDMQKIPALVDDIENMLRNHPDIDNRQVLFVKFIGFGTSTLDILVYTFTKTTEFVKFHVVQQDVLLKIINIVYNKHAAEIAFNTFSLDFENELNVNLKANHNL